jgi:hypothetical protein
MLKDTTNITYEVSPSKARFHEVEIEKQPDSNWKYIKNPFKNRMIGTTVGLCYENFMNKIIVGANKNTLGSIHTILCNSTYAAELWVNNVITDAMLDSIEVGVTGAGRGMTSLIVIPKQKVLLHGQNIELMIMIADSFSHDNFELIDEQNKTLYW